MKYLTLAAALATTVAAWSTELCPPSELEKLLQIAAVPELELCQLDSDFNFIPPSGPPTPDQVALMCLSPACNVTIEALIALDPTDCVTSFSTGSDLNVKQLVTELPVQCAALGV
nr:elicitin-like protein [Pythium porphyrae]